MKNPATLASLKPGQQAVVCALDACGDMRRRLQDIGLISGTRVSCVECSPLGDPVAYSIRGAIIALRGSDARTVRIQSGEEADI